MSTNSSLPVHNFQDGAWHDANGGKVSEDTAIMASIRRSPDFTVVTADNIDALF